MINFFFINIHELNFSGCVVTQECVEKLIKKDMLDPINSQALKSSDIITLQRVSKPKVQTRDFQEFVYIIL